MHQISKIYKWQEISVWVGCYLLGDKKIEIRTTKPVSSSWKSNQFKSVSIEIDSFYQLPPIP